ncbi:MAG: portal protein [Rhodobacter sp.]|nr:portal protein [Rhodobacter sp.]
MESREFWHESEKMMCHDALFSTFDGLVAEQSAFMESLKVLQMAYSDRDCSGFDPGQAQVPLQRNLFFQEDHNGIPITVNAIRACVDTVVAKLTMHDPMPRILPMDAPEATHEKADLLQKFLIGALKDTKIDEETRRAFRDCCVFGTGILRIDEQPGKVIVKRVHPSRIVVDNNAALDGEASTIYMTDHWSKSRVLHTFATKRNKARLKAALNESRTKDMSSGKVMRDLVQIIEAHHRPVGGGPGRRVICLDNMTLVDEPWEDQLPYAVIRWADPDQGWYGVSLSEEIMPIQAELNELSQKIQINMRLLATPFVLVPMGSEVDEASMEEVKTARIIKYHGGVPPRVEIPPAISPQVFQERDSLYSRAFEISGVSQMSASGQKPSGVRNALAMMTLDDIESRRFSQQSHRLENLRVCVSRLVIEAGRRLSSKGWRWSVKGAAKGFVKKIKWSDVSMDDDMFDLQIQPQSSLPYTVGGRIEQVIRLSERGIIAPAEARDLLKMPDLDKWEKLSNAPIDDLQRIFEYMSSTGELIEPHDFQDLSLGKRLAAHYWARARIEQNEKGAEALEAWIELAEPSIQTEQMLGAGLPAGAAPPQGIGGEMGPAGPPPPGMPPALPGPAPGGSPLPLPPPQPANP